MKPNVIPSAVRHQVVRQPRLWVSLTMLLLVSLSCALPSLSRTGVTPVPSAVPVGTPAAVSPSAQPTVGGGPAPAARPSNLPPALVEVDPLPSSTVGPAAEPIFYFNQPMEKASVEAAFQVKPGLTGKFEWINDATLRFVPAQPIKTALDLTIGTAAKAANGKALLSPVSVTYQPAGPFHLAERLPAPGAKDVNPTSAVAVTFTQPVVALGAEAASLPPAFTLDPPAAGRGEWLNTSTYIFYPQPALAGGAAYTVTLTAGLSSLDGGVLDADTPLTWTFTTAAPQVLAVHPASEQAIPLDSPVTVTFNQPMDTAAAQAGFSLNPAGGGAVEGKFTWNPDLTEMTFTPTGLLQRGTVYTVTLAGSVKSQGGAALGQDFAASLTTVPQFAVTQTHPTPGEAFNIFGGYGSVSLTFSSPVASGQNFDQLISISPTVPNASIYREPQGYQLFLSGYFQPATSYTLTAAADLRDRWDARLGAPFSFTFTTPPAPPELILANRQAGSPSLFVPAGDTSVPARAMNINKVNIARGSLTLADFIQAQSGNGMTNWASKTESSWPLILYPKDNISETVNIPLAQDGTALNPGLYFLKLDTQPTSGIMDSPNPDMLVVSPIQMVFKISASQAFVFLVRLTDNTPVANAPVTFYDATAAALGSCTTDANGACQAGLPPRSLDSQALYAVHGQPGAPDFSLAAWNWGAGVSSWEFSLPYQYEGFEPEVYLYTDRPIYRPGQVVDFRLIARAKNNGRYGPPQLNTLNVDVIGPYDPLTGQSPTLTTLRLPLDAYGSAVGVYTLPDDAVVGTYSLHVQELEFKTLYFEVAEYRKPEIDLKVNFDQPVGQFGKDVTAHVAANYFFGAPVSNLPVKWTLIRRPAYLDLPDNLSAGQADTSWLDPLRAGMAGEMFVTEGTAQTGPDGTGVITISGQDLLERLGAAAADAANLQLEVTAADESALPVSARATTRLHPAPYIIGVRPEQWSNQVGQEITFYIRTLDWQYAPAGDKPLTAKFRKVVWSQAETSDPLAPSDLRPQYTDAGSTDFRTSADGEARLGFTPSAAGTYLVDISGPDGADTQVLTWVGGPGSALWPDLPNQHIRLQADAASYQAGQTAHVFIPNPYPEGALALVTIERAKVMRWMVIPVQGASYDLQLPLSADDAPNVYASVTLLNRSGGRPDFRVGYIELTVAPTAQLLKVEVDSSPEQPQPGGDLTLTLRVKDAGGRPVQGQFSVALVDKAVLALADANQPPIDEAFYGHQPLGVQNSLSLAVYGGRFLPTLPGRGGGGGAPDMPMVVRSKFEDTAYWNGAIETDVTGVAQVTVKLPDNLTTWQVDVRGLTSDTRVGQADVDLTTTRPLLIRPVAPRFVVLGDHIELAAVVNNNTAAAVKASARLESAGFTLDNPDLAAQPVDVPANGRTRVSWWGTVQDAPALDLAFSVAAGDLNDAARPELNPVPVLRYAAPQTFATAGMLPDAGEQLELVSLPRSFTPVGGELRVELAPSLSAAVLNGLKAIEDFPRDFTEPVLSRLLPNLAALQALSALQVDNDALRKELETAVNDSAARLVRNQNTDGGWGWTAGTPSRPYLSAYVLIGLSRAAKAGVFVDANVLNNARAYLSGQLLEPSTAAEGWQLDQLVFSLYALQQAGSTDLALGPVYDLRAKLSPWGQALLALTLQGQTPGDERARTLISDLESAASRSATGASWQDPNPAWHSWTSPNFTTAMVAYAVAQIDPTSAVLVDAVRYLTLNRRSAGAWASSYESAWALLALTETAVRSGDAAASYTFSARLNDTPILDGSVTNLTQAASPVAAQQPLTQLNPDSPNALLIQRGAGAGRLYYRAFLQVDRPAQDAPALNRGLALTRQYYSAGQDCRKQACQPIQSASLADPQPVQVRLTLTVPEAMYYVVVEDYFPAGAEAVNPRLKTSQQTVSPDGAEQPQAPLYRLENPFEQGWGWWLFNNPQVYDDHIRWVVDFLPAGTYELTYRLTPILAGEFRLIPARAWQYYFPETEGSSAGGLLTIK